MHENAQVDTFPVFGFHFIPLSYPNQNLIVKLEILRRLTLYWHGLICRQVLPNLLQ